MHGKAEAEVRTELFTKCGIRYMLKAAQCINININLTSEACRLLQILGQVRKKWQILELQLVGQVLQQVTYCREAAGLLLASSLPHLYLILPVTASLCFLRQPHASSPAPFLMRSLGHESPGVQHMLITSCHHHHHHSTRDKPVLDPRSRSITSIHQLSIRNKLHVNNYKSLTFLLPHNSNQIVIKMINS